MTDDEIVVLKRRIEDVIWLALRTGGKDRIQFTVGELLHSSVFLGTEGYDDTNDWIANAVYHAIFGMRISDVYASMEHVGWQFYPIHIRSQLHSPVLNGQKFEFIVFLYCVQDNFEFNIKVSISCYCDLPSIPVQFYSDMLHSYALSNALKFKSSVIELTVAATQQAKAAPAAVPFADIGICDIPDLAHEDMVVANGYDWLNGNLIMAQWQLAE